MPFKLSPTFTVTVTLNQADYDFLVKCSDNINVTPGQFLAEVCHRALRKALCVDTYSVDVEYPVDPGATLTNQWRKFTK